MATNGPYLECRMYEARCPEVDQAVMIQVKSMADSGTYVSPLEYKNIEGMVLFSELSRRRVHSISSLIKVGQIDPVMVLRVDKEKGYIDLTKRRDIGCILEVDYPQDVGFGDTICCISLVN